MPNIKPNQGINIIASAFGCEYTVNDDADPWVTPLIRDDNVQDVHALKIPDPKTNPVFRQAWERIDYLQSHSGLPLRLVNVPSPLVTASLIWEYTSFITATILHPREVHALLEKITEATITCLEEQLARIRNLHTMGREMWYIPREIGVLKKKRMKQKNTQEQLAKMIRSSQSRVAKMETGDPTVSLDLLVRSLLTLGASEKDLAKVIAAVN